MYCFVDSSGACSASANAFAPSPSPSRRYSSRMQFFSLDQTAAGASPTPAPEYPLSSLSRAHTAMTMNDMCAEMLEREPRCLTPTDFADEYIIMFMN